MQYTITNLEIRYFSTNLYKKSISRLVLLKVAEDRLLKKFKKLKNLKHNHP